MWRLWNGNGGTRPPVVVHATGLPLQATCQTRATSSRNMAALTPRTWYVICCAARPLWLLSSTFQACKSTTRKSGASGAHWQICGAGWSGGMQWVRDGLEQRECGCKHSRLGCGRQGMSLTPAARV